MMILPFKQILLKTLYPLFAPNTKNIFSSYKEFQIIYNIRYFKEN